MFYFNYIKDSILQIFLGLKVVSEAVLFGAILFTFFSFWAPLCLKATDYAVYGFLLCFAPLFIPIIILAYISWRLEDEQ